MRTYRFLTFVILVALLAYGCGPKVRMGTPSIPKTTRKSQEMIINPQSPRYKSLTPDEAVRIVLPQDSATYTVTAEPIASYFRGAGLTADCQYSAVLKDISDRARLVGARVVVIKRIWPPDDKTSCFRMSAFLYR